MDREKGAILIILALVLTLIMLFVSLSIDTAMLGSSHQKQSRTAELGALAAIEAYLAYTPPIGLSPSQVIDERLSQARGRAQEVVGFDLNKILSQSDINQDTPDPDGGSTSSVSIGDLTSSGSRGDLIPGQYFFERPDDCATNPVYSNDPCPCIDPVECFKPWTTGSNEQISAFKLRLNTDENNPANTIFAESGGGRKDFRLSSEAISTITPRHAVFLIDMSNSMTAETHSTSTGISSALRSRYAFRIRTTENCTTDTFSDVPGCSRPKYEFANDLSVNGGLGYPGWPTAWGIVDDSNRGNPAWTFQMSPCRDPVVTEPLLRHFKSDYECLDLVDIDGTNISYLLETKYDHPDNARIVDIGAGQTDDYRGAEPLSSVFSAINQALIAFETVTVPGDEISFIAYDSRSPGLPSIVPGTVATPAPDSDVRIVVRASPKTSNFCAQSTNLSDPYCELFRVTDMNDLSEGTIQERATLLLFPLLGARTDFTEALLRASEILVNSPLSDVADNMVVSFGDGLANCYHSGIPGVNSNGDPQDDPTFDSTTPFLLDTPPGPGGSFVATFLGEECLGGGGKVVHDNAISEARAIITGEGRVIPNNLETFVGSGIKFHSFMFGEVVQPHTILRVGDENGDNIGDSCMTEAESRSRDISFTDCGVSPSNPNDANIGLDCSELAQNAPSISSAQEPYFAPNFNFQHQLSNPSGGRFFPVRRPCDPADINQLATGHPDISLPDCLAGRGIDALDSFCGNRSEAIAEVIRFTDDIGGTRVDGTGATVNIPRVIDNGRLICDPRCRSKTAQARQGIDDLFSDNPFITVEP